MAMAYGGFELTPSTLICNRIFDEKVRPFLQEDLTGWYMTVDLDTEDYELDQDHFAGELRLVERRTPGNFYTIRIGYPAAYELGGRPLRPGERFFV